MLSSKNLNSECLWILSSKLKFQNCRVRIHNKTTLARLYSEDGFELTCFQDSWHCQLQQNVFIFACYIFFFHFCCWFALCFIIDYVSKFYRVVSCINVTFVSGWRLCVRKPLLWSRRERAWLRWSNPYKTARKWGAFVTVCLLCCVKSICGF